MVCFILIKFYPVLLKADIMKKILLGLFFLLLLFSCADKKIDKNQITVSILPQAYFVEKIAGDNFKINVMIPPGHSPAAYEPAPDQMRSLSKSIVYFRIGYIPFEKAHIKNLRAVNEKMLIVDTSEGVDLIKTEIEKKNHHAHSKIDPHIWLSPKAVKIINRNIYETLLKIDPSNSNMYTKNYIKFIDEIHILDRKIEQNLIQVKGKKFIVFHPTWSYFARDYGLKQISIEIEGKAPSPFHIKKIIDIAKSENIRTIFVQKQFSTTNAIAIAKDINGNVIHLDPLDKNWIENMKKIALTFKTN